MKLDARFNRAASTNAFIGHAGIGSRLMIKAEGRGFSIQQTIGSQLWLIFSLLAMILVPAYAYFFDRQRINGGLFAYTALAIIELIAIPFFIKYTFRLLGRRRIHVDPILQKIYFYSSGTTAENTVDFASIAKIETQSFDYRSDQSATENFVVKLENRDGKTLELCTSDRESDATEIEQRLSQAIGEQISTKKPLQSRTYDTT